MSPKRRQHLKRALQLTAAMAAGAALLRSPLVSAKLWPNRAKPIELHPMRSVVWQEFLGVNAQLEWFAPDVARLQVQRLKALGLNWVRLGWHWMMMEPKEGQYQLEAYDRTVALIKEAQLHSIVSVVGTPRFATSVKPGEPYAEYFDKFPPKDPVVYAQRMQALAKRYAPVDVWQVWNEPNIPAFWAPKANPEGYARLLQPAVQALREAVPGKPIAMAGMAYYSQMAGRPGLMLEEMGRLGAYELDLIVAYHPYTAQPEGGEDGERDFLSRVGHAHQWLRANKVKQIWATEWGWSSYEGPKEEQPLIGEQGQADYTLRRLALMAALDYDRIFLFTLSDLDGRAGARDRRYGLLRESGEPKPLYHALARFLSICSPRLDPLPPLRLTGDLPDGLVSIHWQRADGRKVWMAWAAQAGTVTLPDVRDGEWHQPTKGGSRQIKAGGQGLDVAVDTTLQILVYG
jgi:beta-xylosidase